MRDAEIYAANAAAMLPGLGPTIAAPSGVVAVAASSGTRYLVRERLSSPTIAGLVDTVASRGPAVVEDPYGVTPVPVGDATTTVRRMPVMNRPPGPVSGGSRPGLTVAPVADADGLAESERVMVEGFPFRRLLPWVAGRALPPGVLELPGWRVWLARRDGVPAAAGYTFDDGAAIGVYWLATLPQHRFVGLGKAVMTAMLAANPRRTATLVATEAAVPLYAGLGFTAVSGAIWYVVNT